MSNQSLLCPSIKYPVLSLPFYIGIYASTRRFSSLFREGVNTHTHNSRGHVCKRGGGGQPPVRNQLGVFFMKKDAECSETEKYVF